MKPPAPCAVCGAPAIVTSEGISHTYYTVRCLHMCVGATRGPAPAAPTRDEAVVKWNKVHAPVVEVVRV